MDGRIVHMITAETFSKHNIPSLFVPVADAIVDAHLVAFDGCHKIYLAMDEIEAEWFRQNYNGVHCSDRTFEGSPEEMLTTVLGWWNESCALRFVNAVHHNEADPNAGFIALIPQGAEGDDEDWDDEDYEDEE